MISQMDNKDIVSEIKGKLKKIAEDNSLVSADSLLRAIYNDVLDTSATRDVMLSQFDDQDIEDEAEWRGINDSIRDAAYTEGYDEGYEKCDRKSSDEITMLRDAIRDDLCGKTSDEVYEKLASMMGLLQLQDTMAFDSMLSETEAIARRSSWYMLSHH